MTKRLRDELVKLKYQNQPLHFGFISLVLIFACVFLMITATFFQFSFSINSFLSDKSFQYLYVPQVPTVMYIAVLLGAKMGVVSILLYVILGMFFPVYALGGGAEYILKPVFGYILAYIPAVVFSGIMSARNYSFVSILRTAAVCTFTIHFIGMMYALLIMAITNSWNGDIFEFVFLQSGIKLLYDYCLCVVAAYLARCTKQLIWLVAS